MRLHLSALALAVGMLFSPVIQAEEYDLRLHLTCRGSGTATRSETTYVNHYNQRTHKNSTTTAQTSRKEDFEGFVVVELSDGRGRIKLPEPMVPPLNTRDNGWFKIHDLVVNSDEITGTVKVNFLNKQNLRIDRRSGFLTIDGGGGSFSGQCDAVDRDTPRRF